MIWDQFLLQKFDLDRSRNQLLSKLLKITLSSFDPNLTSFATSDAEWSSVGICFGVIGRRRRLGLAVASRAAGQSYERGRGGVSRSLKKVEVTIERPTSWSWSSECGVPSFLRRASSSQCCASLSRKSCRCFFRTIAHPTSSHHSKNSERWAETRWPTMTSENRNCLWHCTII